MGTRNIWRKASCYLLYFDGKAWNPSQFGSFPSWGRRSWILTPSTLGWVHRIISMLSTEERGLFRERIRYLDRKIQPGLKKLHWSLKGASTVFISECRLHASKVRMWAPSLPGTRMSCETKIIIMRIDIPRPTTHLAADLPPSQLLCPLSKGGL